MPSASRGWWPLLLGAPAVAAAAECPEHWSGLGGLCFRAFEGPATWLEAQEACEAKGQGAQLASLHSEEENGRAVFACGNTRPFSQGCWIGGSDKREPAWKWLDGSKWDWDRWYHGGGGNGEPNNDVCTDSGKCTIGQTQDCSSLAISKPSAGFWFDAFCTERQKYLCRLDLRPPAVTPSSPGLKMAGRLIFQVVVPQLPQSPPSPDTERAAPSPALAADEGEPVAGDKAVAEVASAAEEPTRAAEVSPSHEEEAASPDVPSAGAGDAPMDEWSDEIYQ